MIKLRSSLLLSIAVLLSACQQQPKEIGEQSTETPMSTSEVMEAATDADWRDLDQDNVIYMELESGLVIIELAPQFAPEHVANIKTLVKEDYFDGLWVIRSHDNYVAQWGEAETETPKSLGSAKANLDPEWESDWKADMPFAKIVDGDIYQADAGYAYGFPVAGNKAKGRIGLAHCYGMVGVGRGGEADSGNGSSLYAVTGHSPRHLDRNVTLVGRVWQGIENLSALPRGTEPLGFYASPEEYTEIYSAYLGSELTEDLQVPLQILRTDTDTFENYLKARRHRSEEWFLDPAGRLELCNVPMPVRNQP